MGTLVQDIRYGLRMLRKSPAFTAVAIVTLALGIGASTVVFTIVNTLYRRPAPVPHAEQIVIAQLKHRDISPAEYSFHREHDRSFSGLAAEWPTFHTYLDSPDNPKMLLAATVSANYFNVLQMRPALGRFFTSEEDQPGSGRAGAVLSDHLWRADFAGDPALLGKTIKLNGALVTVVGVAPAWFHGITAGIDEDLWLPAATAVAMNSTCAIKPQSCRVFENFVARLKPGRTIKATQEEMNALNRQWEAIHPDLKKTKVQVYWARGLRPDWRAETPVLPTLLLLAVAVLLLIACANVAGLMLARGTSRTKEISVRLALGAGRGRIIRQLLTEASLLAVAGCALGLLLLPASAGWLSHFPFHGSEGFASYYDVSLSRPVLLATVALSALTVFVFGLLPALRASGPAPVLALKSADANARQSARLRAVLVVAQVALASTLGCAALLAVRSLDHVLIGPGFDTRHVGFIRVSPYRLGYEPQRAAKVQQEALRRVAAAPGVESVSLAQLEPWWESYEAAIALPGQSQGKIDARPEVHAYYNAVAPNFFATLQIPLLRGRDFTAFDEKNTPRVTIVNASLAHRMWPGRPAVGQNLMIDGIERAVVGVVRDAQYNPASGAHHLFFYLPYWQERDGGDARLFIRARVDPGPVLRHLKLVIRGIDANVPVGEESTMIDGLLGDFGALRFARVVLAFTGAVALFLSAIGLYSILAFLVAQRRREIGIRMALGATRDGIFALVVKQGMKLALAGTIAGAFASLGSTRLLAALLYGVSPTDPVVLMGMALMLMAGCLLASYIPARRATKVDPLVALRYE